VNPAQDPAERSPVPELPSELEPLVRERADADPLEPHPAATALARFDEEPDALSPRARAWIEAHLAACEACRGALRAVPPLGLPARSLSRRLGLVAAAAGWVVAGLLGLGRLGPGRGVPESAGLEPFPEVRTLVLSTSRGDAATLVPAGARILRCELVLGEDVPLGASLLVRLEDAAGRTLLERDELVVERNERDWPVLTLDRAALPAGRARLVVCTPAGLEAAFALDL